MTEEWRDIPGFEGRYQVSDQGRVKSMPKCWILGTSEKCILESIMKPQEHYRGYLFVHLKRPGFRRKYFIHRLVAMAFFPSPIEKDVVNHKDRDKQNNCRGNLEWLTFKENTAHWMAF